MYTLNDVYLTVTNSKDKGELLDIIRSMIPGTMETAIIVAHLEQNPIYDSELKLEALCKMPNRYHSFDFIEDIINCAKNTDLMKKLYNTDVNKFGPFVAANITDQDEIERMYMNGAIEVKRAVACNISTRMEFLEKIIQETTDERVKVFANENLKEISGRN